MAISEPYELDGVDVVTVISIPSGTSSLSTITDDGVYQLWVDAYAMVKGDEFAIAILEKVEATGGTKKQVFKAVLTDVQSEVFVTPTLILMHGWDMTITKVSATTRAFDASIRKVA